jgi:molybdenum cofactor synthesis domain-containing protein
LHHSKMISVADAVSIIKRETAPLPTEQVSLSNALGRCLAEDVIADTDLPPFDRSQMDGYAVRSGDVDAIPTRLLIVGESAAGRGWNQSLRTGQAVRIMTGAPVPTGADSVQQVELTRELDGGAAVEILERVALGRSIVKRGSEVKAGETVLQAGELITPATMAVLASFGYAEVRVAKRPRVAIMATGSELVDVDKKPGDAQIRDSNNYALSAYAELAGAMVERLPLAGDDTELLKKQIADAAERSDIVITSGGVSVGVYDFTKPSLKELGAELFFEKIALRPGKPTVFAKLKNGCLVFGLPGNPVSVAVTFNLFARTAILAMQGAREIELQRQTAVLETSVKGAVERESYLPAQVRTNKSGQLTASPLKWGGSSDFVAFVKATALIVVAADAKVIEAGRTVDVIIVR